MLEKAFFRLNSTLPHCWLTPFCFFLYMDIFYDTKKGMGVCHPFTIEIACKHHHNLTFGLGERTKQTLITFIYDLGHIIHI